MIGSQVNAGAAPNNLRFFFFSGSAEALRECSGSSVSVILTVGSASILGSLVYTSVRALSFSWLDFGWIGGSTYGLAYRQQLT